MEKSIYNNVKKGDSKNDDSNSSRKSINQQGQPQDENLKYEASKFEIQENQSIPRAKHFLGKQEDRNESSASQMGRSSFANMSSYSYGNSTSDQNDSDNQNNDEDKYIIYTTTKQDTLIGLSIKFNISESKIKLINDVSDTVFPGMKLKFPKELCQISESGDKEGQGTIRKKALSLKKESSIPQLTRSNSSSETHRQHFYYCTPYGNIMGCLSINDSVIMFDPSLSNASNMQKLQKKRVIKFQACIDIKDVNEAMAIVLPPRATEISNEDSKEYVLQISLSHIGNKEIYKKYKDRLKQLKKEKKSISTVFFRVFEKDQQGNDLSNQEKQQLVQQFVDIINKKIELFQLRKQELKELEQEKQNEFLTEDEKMELKKRSQSLSLPNKLKSPEKGKEDLTQSEAIQEDNQVASNESLDLDSLTILPFFDIVYENIIQKKKEASQENNNTTQENVTTQENPAQLQMNQYLSLDFAAKMLDTSEILSQEQFLQIIFNVPHMFRYNNWKLIYANMKHGMSFQTLFRNCEDESPVILVIQTFSGDKFGAYLSDPIHSVQHFYGTGECFLFKYIEEEKKIKVFNSTGKNQHFIFANHEYIGVGCGEQYGIYVSKDIYKGQTHTCDTFDNEVLSSDGNENFKIKNIEIWSLEM